MTLAGGHDRSLLYTADLRRSIGSVIDSVFLGHVSEQSGPLGERISQPR